MIGDMALDHADWKRLARYITDRRAALGLTQGEVQAAGGPSMATMRNLEGALQESYRSNIIGRLEQALGWAPGSATVILGGGEPAILQAGASTGRRQEQDQAVQKIMLRNDIPDEKKREIVERLVRVRRADDKRRLELAEEFLQVWDSARGA